MKRTTISRSILLSLIALVIIAVPVLAAYTATYVITETDGTDYDMLAVFDTQDNQYLVDHDFIEATALDTRIETLGGSEQPWMVVDDRTLTAVPVTGNSQTNLYFTTDNALASSMDIICGLDGFITIADSADLEGGADFEYTVDGWVDTDFSSLGQDLIYKRFAFRTYISAATDITSAITQQGWASPTGFVDAGAGWNAETNAYDNNTATAALSNALGIGAWTEWLELTFPATPMINGRFYAANGHGAGGVGGMEIDAYYSGGWTQVYASGGFPDLVWTTFTFAEQTVTAFRVRMQSTGGGGGHTADFREMAYGIDDELASVTASGVASSESLVTTTYDGADLKIFIDTVEEDSQAYVGVMADNANDWILNRQNAVPYMNEFLATVSSVLITQYEPVTMIIGTALPDIQLNNDGVFTWGANPSGIAVALGGLVSDNQPSPGVALDIPTQDILPEAQVTDWFIAPAVGGTLLTNPFRPFVTIMSDSTTINELQAWRLLGFAVVLLVMITTALAVKSHLLISGIMTGATIGVMVALTIFPMWALVFSIGAVGSGIVAERSPIL